MWQKKTLEVSQQARAILSRDCWNFLHAAGLHGGSFFIEPRKFSHLPDVIFCRNTLPFAVLKLKWLTFPTSLST